MLRPPAETRVVLSKVDLAARAYIRELCRAAGLIVREDAVGHLFARYRFGTWPCGNRDGLTHRCDSPCRTVRWHGRCPRWSGSDSRASARRLSATALDRTSDVHVGGADSFRHWMFGQPFAVGELESRTSQNPYRQRCTVFGSSPNRSRIYRRAD